MPTTLITAMTTEALATRLADTLMEGEHHLAIAAAGAFEQAPPHWRFEAWFPQAPDLGEFHMVVAGILGADAAGIAFEVAQVDDTDWVSKSLEDLPPVREGRFVVHGAHDRHKVRENEIGLEIEASLAFGTGHHGTTAGCLMEIDRLVARDRHNARRPLTGHALLDVGTGTGVLAIAAVKALPIGAVAGDLDRDSVRIARENAKLAGVADRLRVVEAVGVKSNAMRAHAPYPVVVANILAGPLCALATDLTRATRPGGVIILSGLLWWQARMVIAAYVNRGCRLVSNRIIGDWSTLVLVRR